MSQTKDNRSVDFIKVIGILVSHFRKMNIPYMLVGGVALGVWGIPRGTKDLDFMIMNADQSNVDSIMKVEGYDLFNNAKGFMQYEHFLVVYGLVDYLLSRSKIGDSMIERAVEKDLGEDIGKVRVATLEDMIILKVLAIKNNEARPLDRQDVRDIIGFYGDRLDWPYIEEYVKMLEMEEVLKNVRAELQ